MRPSERIHLRAVIERGSMSVPFTSCRMWIKGYGSHGYGAVHLPGTKNVVTAQKASYLAYIGELEPGEVVRHSCDWKPCVNPDHLLCGTHSDNGIDASRSGLLNAKVTPEDILEVRRMLRERYSYRDIGERFGVTAQNIHLIATGQTWSHVK